MPLRISIAATSISDQAQMAFVRDTKLAFAVYKSLRWRRKLPASDLDVTLTDNYLTDIRRLLRPSLHLYSADLTDNQVMGSGTGINVAQTDDYSRIAIVFNAAHWQDHSEPTGQARLQELYLIAHELAHPLLSRARLVSGVLEGEAWPPVTGGQIARFMARILADEYRADRLADLVVGNVMSVTSNGVTRPARIWDIGSETFRARVQQSFDEVYPRWPDTVDDYRRWKLSLNELWNSIYHSTEQLLTRLVHAQAAADAEGLPALLEDESFASLPVVRLYLAKPFARFIGAVRGLPLVPTMRQVKSGDGEIARVGESAIREIWEHVGLQIDDRADRQLVVCVSEPER